MIGAEESDSNMTDKSQTYAKAFLQAIAQSHDEEKLRDFSQHFLAVLKRKRELYFLPKIIKSLERMLAEEKGTLVTSRFTLDQHSREKLANFLKKTFSDFHEKDIVFETNENILGGVAVRHKDFLYDATIDTSLAKFKAVWK